MNRIIAYGTELYGVKGGFVLEINEVIEMGEKLL